MYISKNLYIYEFACICTLRWWTDMLSRYRHRCCRRCLFFCFFTVMLDFDLISNSLSSSRFSVFSCALENVLLALAFTVIHYTNMLSIFHDVLHFGRRNGRDQNRTREITVSIVNDDLRVFQCGFVCLQALRTRTNLPSPQQWECCNNGACCASVDVVSFSSFMSYYEDWALKKISTTDIENFGTPSTDCWSLDSEILHLVRVKKMRTRRMLSQQGRSVYDVSPMLIRSPDSDAKSQTLWKGIVQPVCHSITLLAGWQWLDSSTGIPARER